MGRWYDKRFAGEPEIALCWNSFVRSAEKRMRVLSVRSDRRWDLIRFTSQLDWLLLTKNPRALRAKLPAAWLLNPAHNVWIGTRVIDQQSAKARLLELAATPAVVRFIVCNPTESIELPLRPALRHCRACGSVFLGGRAQCSKHPGPPRARDAIDWAVVIGDGKHAHALVDQCRGAGVAVFAPKFGVREFPKVVT